MSDIAHTLSREAEAARTLLLNIKDVIGDDEQAAADAIEGETSFREACDAAAQRVAEIDALSDAINAQKKRLEARLARLEAQGDAIRTALSVALGTAGVARLELATATVSLKKVPPKLIILDEAAIPADYWKRGDPKLDRKAVTDALKSEQQVPGATLSNGGETIQIRWG